MPPAPVYYHPRDQLSPRLLLTLPVGGGAAVVLGIIYAFVSSLVTQVFEESALFIVVTPLFGGALAVASRWVADRAQVRQRRLRLALALAMTAVGLYAGWQAYLVLADLRVFDFTPTWTMSPARLVHGIVELANNNGRWSWLLWTVEAATLFGMVVYLMRAVDIEVPFCDHCNAWTKTVLTFELADADTSAAAERLLAGDAVALATMRPRPRGESEYAVVRVYRCSCAMSRYVSLDRAHRDAGERAGLRTYSVIGSRPSIYFSLGRARPQI